MAFRKALGTVKDQTSIGIAKVSGNLAPDLEVAIVKATSHDEEPASERHVREILAFTSYSQAYVSVCVDKVSRRLSKTRDWIVALKSLSLIHRLLSDGDPTFLVEILHATRRGSRLLNLSDFRDEAHSNSWDHSAFVRSYALYLDQRLDSALHDSNLHSSKSHERSASSANLDYSYSYNSTPTRTHRSMSLNEKKLPQRTPIRDMTSEDMIGSMHDLRRLLDRFLACRPTARAKTARLVLVALYPIVRESFKIYADLCQLLGALLDRFFEMEYADCVKAFEVYATAAKQIDELVKFYGWCKETGVAKSSEYPEVQRISDKLLDTLEEFMRDKAGRTKSPERPVEPPIVEKEEEAVEDMSSIKALPPPEGWEEEKPAEVAPKPEKKPEVTGDLVDLREENSSADDQGNRLALALFSGPTNNSWNTYADGKPEVTSAWQTPAAEPGKADWELALVESASNLARQKPALAGGFDPVLLDGMYDQGIVRQHVSAQVTGGSASSVALPGLGRSSTPVLALPAPDGSVQNIGQDPFAASLSVPPPSYVQMSDIDKKQQLLLQEQLLWQAYARDGMQGQGSLSKLQFGYNHGAPPMMMPYGMPQPVNGGGYYYPQYPEAIERQFRDGPDDDEEAARNEEGVSEEPTPTNRARGRGHGRGRERSGARGCPRRQIRASTIDDFETPFQDHAIPTSPSTPAAPVKERGPSDAGPSRCSPLPVLHMDDVGPLDGSMILHIDEASQIMPSSQLQPEALPQESDERPPKLRVFRRRKRV